MTGLILVRHREKLNVPLLRAAGHVVRPSGARRLPPRRGGLLPNYGSSGRSILAGGRDRPTCWLAWPPGLPEPLASPQRLPQECQLPPQELAFLGAGGGLRPRGGPEWAKSDENCPSMPPSDEPRVGILGGREGSRPRGGPG
jgi:hypothetical protein